jgi:hypothetical protein
MKIKILIIILSLPVFLFAQEEPPKEKKVRDHGLILLLGPAINYHYGPKTDEKGYSDSRISWQFDGQFGFLSTRRNLHRGNFLGVFGSFGSMSSDVLQELADQAGRGVAIKSKQFNQFFSTEAGMIIFNFLRISGGIGRQYFEDAVTGPAAIQYYSLTGGLNFNFGAVNLGVNANLLTGGDLVNNQLRFSTGLLIKF